MAREREKKARYASIGLAEVRLSTAEVRVSTKLSIGDLKPITIAQHRPYHSRSHISRRRE